MQLLTVEHAREKKRSTLHAQFVLRNVTGETRAFRAKTRSHGGTARRLYWFAYVRKLSFRKLRDRHLSTVSIVPVDGIRALKRPHELNSVPDPSTRAQ